MENFLSHHKLKIHASSPIFIGNGDKIGKKEFIFLRKEQTILVPKMERLYAYLQKHRLAEEYEQYLFDEENKQKLGDWLWKAGVPRKDYEQFTDYRLHTEEDIFERCGRERPASEILCFIKDPYGKPYVPGSSLKGMLRTALLIAELQKNKRSCRELVDEVNRASSQRGQARTFLNRECREVETAIFHKLIHEGTKKEDAVNNCLSGLIIGDSRPIKIGDLTLSQKIDYNLKKEERPLPLLRECLAPGTEFYFDVSIDTQVCPYTMGDLLEALDLMNKICYKFFYSRFFTWPLRSGTVWLGGGSGFLSKTVLYPMFEEEAVRVTDRIFQTTLGKKYFEHKHERDTNEYRLAPHVCKCTRYQQKLYPMGRGELSELS